jgi:hypothetical protein
VIEDVIARNGSGKKEGTELIDDLLGSSSSPSDKGIEDLIISNHINQGILKIFEGKYEDAI